MARLPKGEKLLDEIARFYDEVCSPDARRNATRRLAELIAATRQDPDPGVNPTAAAKRLGKNKAYAHALVRRLEDGALD